MWNVKSGHHLHCDAGIEKQPLKMRLSVDLEGLEGCLLPWSVLEASPEPIQVPSWDGSKRLRSVLRCGLFNSLLRSPEGVLELFGFAVTSLVRPSIYWPLTQILKAVYDTYLEIDTDESVTKWRDKSASKLSLFMLNWTSSSWNEALAVKWSEDKGLPLKKDAAVTFQNSHHMKGLIFRNWQQDTGVWFQPPYSGKQFGWKWTYGDKELNSV